MTYIFAIFDTSENNYMHAKIGYDNADITYIICTFVYTFTFHCFP